MNQDEEYEKMIDEEIEVNGYSQYLYGASARIYERINQDRKLLSANLEPRIDDHLKIKNNVRQHWGLILGRLYWIVPESQVADIPRKVPRNKIMIVKDE